MIIKKRSIIAVIFTLSSLLLTEKYWLIKSASHIKLEVEIFIIVAILSFLLFYKLTDYIAEIKTVNEKPRADIIFLTIFFVLLFIPAIHIDNRVKFVEENRNLKVWTPLIKDNKINYNFGKDFEEWFNDRFFGRKILISFFHSKYKLNKYWMTGKVIQGKDNWFFLNSKERNYNFCHNHFFNKKDLKKVNKYLKDIDEECRKNGKKFYFIICPEKESIYKEYYTPYILQKGEYNQAEQLINYINEHSAVKVVFPKQAILDKKGKDLLYFKNDTHWNEMGSYYAYKELMELIQRDFKNISVYKVKKYTEIKDKGDLNNMLSGVLKLKELPSYKVPDISDINVKCSNEINERKNTRCESDNKQLNLNMYRDSYTNALGKYIASSFKVTDFFSQYNIKKSSIEDKNVDVIILEVVERNINMLVKAKVEDK